MKAASLLLLALAAFALGLSGCASPYQHALDNPEMERPEPPMTPADLRAKAPYDESHYFD